MQLPSNRHSWYYHWNALTTSSDQDMSLTFTKFAQLPKALFGTITVLLFMSSSDKDKTISRFLILEHEWVTKCQIKVDVPTLILVY
jgi:hypothetical protein